MRFPQRQCVMVEGWYKAWSVHLLLLFGFVAELAPYIPDIQQALPAYWYQWAFRIILLARIIKQRLPSAPNA